MRNMVLLPRMKVKFETCTVSERRKKDENETESIFFIKDLSSFRELVIERPYRHDERSQMHLLRVSPSQKNSEGVPISAPREK